jgi:hypothetical protein
MRTIGIALTALLLLTGTASASAVETLECGQIRYTPSDNSRDPIIKIKVTMSWSPASVHNPTGFEVEHYSAAGQVYSREDQYRDIRMWSTKVSDNWSGVSIRNPELTMVGTVYGERGRKLYVEKIFKRGQLETTINSTCRFVEEESH